MNNSAELNTRNYDIGMLSFVILSIISFLFISDDLVSQDLASPANWLYQDANPAATKYVRFRSSSQSMDSMSVKWSTKAIYGDITPLIGNIIKNPTLRPGFVYAPNEMSAIVGNNLVVVDGRGKVFQSDDFTQNGRFNFINSVSVMFDTLLTEFSDDVRGQVVLGLETIETDRTNIENPDSLAVAYIAGFDHVNEKPDIIKRMAIDMRDFPPNYSAAIRPIYGWNYGGKTAIYAQVNTARPTIPLNFDPLDDPAPYFRGIIQFDADISISNFPLNDIGYDPSNILTMGPKTNFSVPSISNFENVRTSMLIPVQAESRFSIEMPSKDVNGFTFSNESYLYRVVFDDEDLEVNVNEQISDMVNGTGAMLRPLTIELWDPDFNQTKQFILMAEQYSGVDGSSGTSYLHLFDNDEGISITKTGSTPPPYRGGENQMWSIATGNLDGNNDNELLPYYPNNPGLEIIATNSSKEFAVADSKIHVLKYNGFTQLIPKTSPPNTFLYDLDTVCTQQINGWVAAVNDLDGADNRKDEILIVNGSRIMVLQLRDYESFEFRVGNRFDTLMTMDFPGETISNALIADMEGDGKNDIIVTTFTATHVVGVPLDDVLNVFSPQTLSGEVCAGDTVKIEWENFVVNDKDVEILFQELDSSDDLLDDPILIADSLNNFNDTLSYNYVSDSTLVGKRGFFIVRVMDNPDQIVDYTGVITFNRPNVQIISSNFRSLYRVGDEIEFTGVTFCYDSLEVQLSSDGQDWQRLVLDEEETSSTFSISAEIPCLNIFECDMPGNTKDVFFRVISYKSEFSATSSSFSLPVGPARFELEIDSTVTASPAKLFSWNASDFEYACDSISIYISPNFGSTFTYVNTIEASEEFYQWDVPLNLPDSVIVRFCCESSCIGIDTMVTGTSVSSIKLVAPNPFNPPFQQLEIVYFVTEDTNVDIWILDQSNRIVAQPVKNVLRYKDIAYTDYWDGRLSNGELAANGLYYIRLMKSNGDTEIYPVFLRK